MFLRRVEAELIPGSEYEVADRLLCSVLDNPLSRCQELSRRCAELLAKVAKARQHQARTEAEWEATICPTEDVFPYLTRHYDAGKVREVAQNVREQGVWLISAS